MKHRKEYNQTGAYFQVVTSRLKYIVLLSCVLAALQATGQDATDDSGFNIALKLSVLPTATYFNNLQMDYVDQSPSPNHILADFSLGNNPVLYGGEVIFASRLFRKGFYFDGIGFGIHAGNHSSLFEYQSGAGYGVRIRDKWKVVASVTGGYCMYGKLLSHHYYTSATPLVVNGKIIDGPFELEILRHSIFAKPQLTLQYQLKWLSLHVFGGYRFNFSDKEMIGISERDTNLNTSPPKTARVSTGSSIKSNGQYVQGKLMNLNGFIIGVGAVINIYY